MTCTQLMIIEQPKKEESTVSLHSPYDHPEIVRERIVVPMAIGLTQLAQLVYGKQ